MFFIHTVAQQHVIDLHVIFQGDFRGGSFGEGDPVGEEEGPGAASASGVCPGALSDSGSESDDSRSENDSGSENYSGSENDSGNGDEAVVEFVKVKRKGKISVQALFNNVKFYILQ